MEFMIVYFGEGGRIGFRCWFIFDCLGIVGSLFNFGVVVFLL